MTTSPSSVPTHQEWEIPWGPGKISISPPDSQPISVLERFVPDFSKPLAGEYEYGTCLNQELDFPRDQPRLETRIGADSRIAIVVDDPSRWSPLKWALPVILERLQQSGVNRDNISVSFGVGRHAAVSKEDMIRKLGDRIVSQFQCLSPPVDDLSAYEDLGSSADGIPVRVFRPIAKADLRILVGSVLPHLQAGFGGGWKLIFPGCSHRSTLGAIHQQGLDGKAAQLLGMEPSFNPMRQAIGRAAKLLPGGTLSVSHVIGRSSEEIFAVSAGDPDQVEQHLATMARQRFEYSQGPQSLADLIIVGNAPWPGDPMHSFKTLLNHRNACKPGGILAGIFWTDPEELGRSFPLGIARAIAQSGKIGTLATRIGLPFAEKLASFSGSSKRFMMRWAKELVLERTVIVYSPEMAETFGRSLGPVKIVRNSEEFWKEVQKAHSPIKKCTIFPYGGLSYAPIRHS